MQRVSLEPLLPQSSAHRRSASDPACFLHGLPGLDGVMAKHPPESSRKRDEKGGHTSKARVCSGCWIHKFLEISPQVKHPLIAVSDFRDLPLACAVPL